MRETLVIFRKDVKHLWPLGAAVSALVILHGWIDIQMADAYLKTINTRLYDYERWLIFVAWWCLVGLLQQQERSVGGRAYWITRPISRKSLLGAKALFLVTFLAVPSFMVQAVVLRMTGFPLAHYFAAMIWNQILLFCYFAMAGALAAVTRNFRLYAVTSLVIFTGLVFLLVSVLNREGGQWGGVQWVQEAGSQAVFLAAAASVLALQYASRHTAISRSILGAGVLLTFLLFGTDWWHAAFALTSAAAGRPDAASQQVRIVFDAYASPSAPDGLHYSTIDETRIAIPVRVSGLPQGRELSSERVSLTIHGPGSAIWSSGWRLSNELAARTTWDGSDEWLAEDGRYWLSFNVPIDYFDAVKDAPVRIRARLALSEFTSPEITRLPAGERHIVVSNAGLCGRGTIIFTKVSCVMPFENRVAVDFRFQPHGGTPFEISGCCTISYGPFNMAGGFGLWGEVGSMPSGRHQFSPDDDVSIEVRRPLAHFEREIEIPAIVMARYQARYTEAP